MNSLEDDHDTILGTVILQKVFILVEQAIDKFVNNFKQN